MPAGPNKAHGCEDRFTYYLILVMSSSCYLVSNGTALPLLEARSRSRIGHSPTEKLFLTLATAPGAANVPATAKQSCGHGFVARRPENFFKKQASQLVEE